MSRRRARLAIIPDKTPTTTPIAFPFAADVLSARHMRMRRAGRGARTCDDRGKKGECLVARRGAGAGLSHHDHQWNRPEDSSNRQLSAERVNE